MNSGEDLNLSHKYATAALMALKEHKLPATPDLIHLWYAYYSGLPPTLRAGMESILKSAEPLTVERCGQLFDQHLGSGRHDDTLHDTSLKVETTLGQIMKLLSNANSDNERFGATLNAATGSLEQASNDPKALRKLVDSLAQETRQALAANQRLRGNLQNSTQEITSLRSNLEEVRREAMTDALTGIGNRKLFDLQLRQAVAEAMSRGGELSLLMMDIDYFKKFNDKYGHQLGDQVLRLVARCLTECVKGRDTAARYGGEEFAVVLPNTSLEDAVTVAEQIRNTVAARRIIRRKTDEDLGGITVSIGVAQFMVGESEQALIARADHALYAAKNAGRNRTVTEADTDKPKLAVVS